VGKLLGGSILVLLLAGCGYHLAGSGLDRGGVAKIAIETPRNDSLQPGMEFFVADALRREALRRGGARLTDDVAAADLVVSGRVVDLVTRPRTFSSVVLALENEVTLDLEFTARRRGAEAPVFDALRFSESERYLTSADNQAERKNRKEALRRVAQVLAARALDAVSEGLR
jgi:outer membrane lipopolysaccharide assembly protein LptE/RlpB